MKQLVIGETRKRIRTHDAATPAGAGGQLLLLISRGFSSLAEPRQSHLSAHFDFESAESARSPRAFVCAPRRANLTQVGEHTTPGYQTPVKLIRAETLPKLLHRLRERL